MMSEKAYKEIKTYCDDLSERIRLLDEWKLRHSDWDSLEFREDERAYCREEKINGFISSFDPFDDSPDVGDVLTSQRFNYLMQVAVAAYEKAVRDE
jgi:hypothetical protein